MSDRSEIGSGFHTCTTSGYLQTMLTVFHNWVGKSLGLPAIILTPLFEDGGLWVRGVRRSNSLAGRK